MALLVNVLPTNFSQSLHLQLGEHLMNMHFPFLLLPWLLGLPLQHLGHQRPIHHGLEEAFYFSMIHSLIDGEY